jgi:uncharacterized membrane protein YkvA (DUF1232 family)
MQMVLPGVLALFAGAVLTFAVHGHVGGVSVTALGLVTMVVGGLILIVGLIRLGRGRRRRVVGGRVVAGRVVGGVQERAYRTSKGKIAAMVIAVIYIVSPIDIIPDFLLPVGIIDDATAFSWLLFAIGQEFTRKRQRAL